MANSLDLVRLAPLLALTSGTPDVMIALVDGRVAITHPDLVDTRIREISGSGHAGCAQMSSIACLHGTFVAGILGARRGSSAPAICPGCVLLLRPVFAEGSTASATMANATPQELAAAIKECIDAGARIINLSLTVTRPSPAGERLLELVLDQAAKRGVIVVAAAGNEGTLGSSAITRHAWTVPVAAYGPHGRPMDQSNLGSSIGRRGLGAPGAQITSLGANGQPLTMSGTSVAAPFVTGAVALLWSLFPHATAAQIKLAITQAYAVRRGMVAPPLLDAWGSYQHLSALHARRQLA